jgi:hypothetical protein
MTGEWTVTGGTYSQSIHKKEALLRSFVFALCTLAALAGPIAVGAAPPPTAVGGSTQAQAQDGCMNQWMFNGVWRVRVTSVVWQPKDADHINAWLVTTQWGNGTTFAGITPVDTYIQDPVLALANGDTMAASDLTTGTLIAQKLAYHSFPASGQFTHTQVYGSVDPLDPNNKPAKLLITFDVAKYKVNNPNGSGKFWNQKTPGYNYRINLTCTK